MKLLIPELKITDLLTNKGFNKFKDNFTLQSIEFKNVDNKEDLSPQFTGEVLQFDSNGNEKTFCYYSDYLPHAVSNLSKSYLKELKQESKDIYATDARVNFLNQKLREIHLIIEKYRSAAHLESPEKELIISELEKLSDRLSDKMNDLIEVADDKITFDLKKNEVLLLFKLFHELGIIKGITIYDLWRFVEKHINFRDHQEIKSANKSFNTEMARLNKSKGNRFQFNDIALINLIREILKI